MTAPASATALTTDDLDRLRCAGAEVGLRVEFADMSHLPNVRPGFFCVGPPGRRTLAVLDEGLSFEEAFDALKWTARASELRSPGR